MNNLVALLGDTLLQPGGGGTVSTSEALKSKTVGLYFSAHWCPPCSKFTPQLAKAYAASKEAGNDFEIVYVSSDRDEDAFDKYHGEMPWLALPFLSRDKKRSLAEIYYASGIPTLVVLGSDGEVITENGCMSVSKGSYIEEFFPLILRSSGFFDSCLSGDASKVKRWLEKDPNYVNREAPQDWHACHVLGEGWQPVVNPPRPTNAAGTAHLVANHPAYGLHVAAANGHTDVVRILLDAGAELEAKDGDGDTPLAWATYCGRREMMDLLLAAGANPAFPHSISRKKYEGIKGDGASLEYLKQKTQGTANFTGKKPDYQFGDITKTCAANTKEGITNFTGKPKYQFGDITKTCVSNFTGKPDYHFGDITKTGVNFMGNLSHGRKKKVKKKG